MITLTCILLGLTPILPVFTITPGSGGVASASTSSQRFAGQVGEVEGASLYNDPSKLDSDATAFLGFIGLSSDGTEVNAYQSSLEASEAPVYSNMVKVGDWAEYLVEGAVNATVSCDYDVDPDYYLPLSTGDRVRVTITEIAENPAYAVYMNDTECYGYYIPTLSLSLNGVEIAESAYNFVPFYIGSASIWNSFYPMIHQTKEDGYWVSLQTHKLYVQSYAPYYINNFTLTLNGDRATINCNISEYNHLQIISSRSLGVPVEISCIRNQTQNPYIPNGSYRVKLSSTNIVGLIGPPRPKAVIIQTPTQGDVSTTSVLVKWSQSTAGNFTKYELYIATTPSIYDPGQLMATITSKATTSYRVNGLDPSACYYFTVRVHTPACYADSDIVCFQTLGTSPNQPLRIGRVEITDPNASLPVIDTKKDFGVRVVISKVSKACTISVYNVTAPPLEMRPEPWAMDEYGRIRTLGKIVNITASDSADFVGGLQLWVKNSELDTLGIDYYQMLVERAMRIFGWDANADTWRDVYSIWASPYQPTGGWGSGGGLDTFYMTSDIDGPNLFTITYRLPATPVTLQTPTPGDFTEDSVKLTWSQNDDPDFYSYQIFMSSQPNEIGNAIVEILDQSVMSYSVALKDTDNICYVTVRVRPKADTNWQIDWQKLYSDSNTVRIVLIEDLLVTTPNGGEYWVSTSTYEITWTSSGNPIGYVKIELLKDGAPCKIIASKVLNTGKYNWTIPLSVTPGDYYSIRVTRTSDTRVTDSSDTYFSIAGEWLSVDSPTWGDSWVSGSTHEIKWFSNGDPKAYVKIELMKFAAGSGGIMVNKVIVSSTPNDGSYNWTIPVTQPTGSDYIVVVTRTTYPTGGGPASGWSLQFSLIPENLTITSPKGGENWVSGTTHTITWSSTGSSKAPVKIELVRPGATNRVIVASTPNDGSYDWTIPMSQALGSDYSIKITRTTYPTGSTPASDTSDSYFALMPESLTLTSPNGGENLVSGNAYKVTWASNGNPKAYVKIELVKPGALNKVIASSAPNNGSYLWTIPMTQPLGSDYRLRITRTTYPAGSKPANDTSNNSFSLIPETLSLMSPDGGQSWVGGSSHEITWASTGSPKAYVKIELVKPGVANRVIVGSTPNDGVYDWTIPMTQPLGSDYTVKITRTTFSTGSTAATDSSNAVFALISETLTVTYPNGGEEWVGGTTNSITWTSTGSPTAYVKIELVKPGVLNRGIISSTLNDGSYDWVIPMTQALGSDYSVKITRTTFPTGSTAATDYSDEYFSIAPEELAVTSPNGGESWVRGTVHGITWVTTGSSNAYVRIELLKGGELRRVIASSALNKGTYSWAIPAALALGVDYSVRVTRTSGFRVGDSSDAYFSVVS